MGYPSPLSLSLYPILGLNAGWEMESSKSPGGWLQASSHGDYKSQLPREMNAASLSHSNLWLLDMETQETMSDHQREDLIPSMHWTSLA